MGAQDHIGAGVLMTKRDTFFMRSQFMQLLYAACCPSRPGADAEAVGNLQIPAPALIVPKKLYTGKQVGHKLTLPCILGRNWYLTVTVFLMRHST